MLTRCSYCGNEFPQNARFCNNCGMLIPSSNRQIQTPSSSDSNRNNSMDSNPGNQDAQATSPDSWSALQRREPSVSSDQDVTRETMPQGATPWLGLQPNNITPWLGLPSGSQMPLDGSDRQDEASNSASSKVRPSRAGRLMRNTDTEREQHIDEISTQQLPSDPDIEDMPTIATARSPLPLASQVSSMPQTPPVAPQMPATPLVQNTPAIEVRSGRPRRHLLAAVVAAGIVLVLIIGSILFIVAHSSVDINPLQTMNDSTLGVSMSYPTGWREVDGPSSLTLTDSSNTAQIKIARSATDDAGQALQKVTSQIGMTDGKAGSAITFGNCTWQQMTGNFQIEGVDYHGTIYACNHNHQIYTLLQMSPKSTYADEESIVFAPARASLRLR